VLTSNGVDALWGNLVAGTNITISSTGGNTTINSTGGGSGCTLPSHNTGVLSEHPAGTCYDSLDWTWDDNNAVGFIENHGDGTNISCTVAGINTCTLVFSQGTGNQIDKASGGGSSTDVTQAVWVQGTSNQPIYNITDSWVWGTLNVIHGDTNLTNELDEIYVMGKSATITGTGASSSGFELWDIGDSNFMTVATGGFINVLYVIGKANSLSSTGASSVMSSEFVIGEGNTNGAGVGATVQDNFIMGETNTTTGGNSTSSTKGQITLGFNNTATTNGTNSAIVEDYIFGDHNGTKATNNGESLSQMMVIGHGTILEDCSHCYYFGESGSSTFTTSNQLQIGMSSAPEIQIVSGVVGLAPTITITATAFASLGTPSNGTFKYCNDCTIANPCAGAGSGAFAKRLNGVWVCN
jgi:hypothetical protein